MRHQKDLKFHVESLDLLIRFGFLQSLDTDFLPFSDLFYFDPGLRFLAKSLLNFDFGSLFEVGL